VGREEAVLRVRVHRRAVQAHRAAAVLVVLVVLVVLAKAALVLLPVVRGMEFSILFTSLMAIASAVQFTCLTLSASTGLCIDITCFVSKSDILTRNAVPRQAKAQHHPTRVAQPDLALVSNLATEAANTTGEDPKHPTNQEVNHL